MKKYLLALLLLPTLLSCGNTEITEDNYTDLVGMETTPEIEFEKAEYDFGTIIEGAVVSYRFEFTNSGNGPLIISAVDTPCGCTVVKTWSKEPIKPGEKGYIDAIFNSEGFPGAANKNLTVVANTFPTNTTIKLKGTVLGPEL